MNNQLLERQIFELHGVRRELRALQERARVLNGLIIEALEETNGEYVTTDNVKAKLQVRMLEHFDSKAAKAANADFVAKYTVTKATTVLLLT